MKQFNLTSFGLGLVSGIIVLFLLSGTLGLFRGSGTGGAANSGFRTGGNPARMAQRLGMTQDELQKELDSGKTMQQIFAEHGIQPGQGRRSGSGSVRPTGSGAAISSSSSSVSSHS